MTQDYKLFWSKVFSSQSSPMPIIDNNGMVHTAANRIPVDIRGCEIIESHIGSKDGVAFILSAEQDRQLEGALTWLTGQLPDTEPGHIVIDEVGGGSVRLTFSTSLKQKIDALMEAGPRREGRINYSAEPNGRA